MSLWSWLGKAIGLGTNFGGFWSTYAGAGSDSGELVTPDRVMQISAAARAIRLNATTIATLPLNLYEVPSAGGEARVVRDGSNEYDQVLRVSPNENQTPTEFWEGIIAGLERDGNGFALKQRSQGRIVGFETVDSLTTEVYRSAESGALKYRGTRSTGERFDVFAKEMFHIKGFCFGGDRGFSPVQLGANAFGNVMSATRASGNMLRSGLSASGFLETGQVLNEGDRTRLTQIMSDYAGSEKAGKLMILEGGMKYNRLSMSAVDAQLLLQVGFGIEEIARWFDIPPILLGHNANGQTMWGTGVEAIILSWYTLGLRPRLKRIETAISKRVIEPRDRSKYFAKFNVDGLLRGDSAAQAALFSAASQNGWLTRNEIRKLLDLTPLPGGDDLTVQVNMTLLKDLKAANQRSATEARAALLPLLGITPGMLEDKAPAKIEGT